MPELEARLLLTRHRQENRPQKEKVGILRSRIESLYKGTEARLPFHGWHHVNFVAEKGKEFAFIEQQRLHLRGKLVFDENLPYFVEAIGLVHDLNYLVAVNSAEPAAETLRRQILHASGYEREEVQRIEDVIQNRDKDSFIAHCFLDADKAAKFDLKLRELTEGQFIIEQGITDHVLARSIYKEQVRPVLFGKRPLFHTNVAHVQYGEQALLDFYRWTTTFFEQTLRRKTGNKKRRTP